MKFDSLLLMLLLLLGTRSESDLYDLVDNPDKTEDPNSIKIDHASPDINCLLREYGNFFAETRKEMNGFVHPEPFNLALDPLMIDLNKRIAEKEEGKDPFLTIKDINELFQIDGEEFLDLRVFFDECSHIPEKMNLMINELNYYYCVLVWKNGFQIFSSKLIEKTEYRKGFLRVIETSVAQIFNYKTYIHTVILTPILNNSWKEFYSNLNEYIMLNKQYQDLSREIIIGIKQNNFFFNKEEYIDRNMFFKFYQNNLEILRALNDAYFHFTVGNDRYLNSMQEHAENFRQIISEELYGSLFYLFMRNDDVFLENFVKHASKWHYLIDEMAEAFKKTEDDIKEFVQRLIDEDDTFDSSSLDPDRPPRKITGIPSEHPLLNSELDKYKRRKDYSEMPPLARNPEPTEKELILAGNKRGQEIVEQDANLRHFVSQFKIMGPHEPNGQGRVLQAVTKKIEKHLKQTKKARSRMTSASLEKRRAFHQFEIFDRKIRNNNRNLLKVPAQPEISEPKKFFDRMDELKKPLSTRQRRMTLTEFFKLYEKRVVDYYGYTINIDLVRTCKQHMTSKIKHIANIFCLIMQRETHLLVQQKYANSRLKTFIEKYLPFITYNFFTYFRVLEEKNDRVDIAVLTLFYNEKFFSAIKLAIVSLNNLIVHYEDEYKDYYKNQLEEIMMPLINRFKSVVMGAFFSFGDKLKLRYVESWELTTDDIRIQYLPLFREKLESLILVPTTHDQNASELKNQYNDYINSMNLLSFDTIKKNFVAYSKSLGLVTSSEGPSKECEEIFLMDVVRAHKREMMAQQGKGQMDEEEEYKCIKNWKLYDEVFHNVFFNTDTKEVIIKSKTGGSLVEKNQFDSMMENELKRVVNYFIPSRMQDALEKLHGETQSKFQRCGIIPEWSRSACFAIFGNNNCEPVSDTIYYTRKCPKGYKQSSIGCVFNCAKENMEEDGEFCIKEEADKPCPNGTLTVDETKCMKPMRRYFMYIQNPFNLKA